MFSSEQTLASSLRAASRCALAVTPAIVFAVTHALRVDGTLSPAAAEGGRREDEVRASMLTRARWAAVVALAAGSVAWLLAPALVRHTIGGECTGFWKLAGAQIDTNGNLVIDPGSCPLTGAETMAVWITALAVALIAGVATLRLART